MNILFTIVVFLLFLALVDSSFDIENIKKYKNDRHRIVKYRLIEICIAITMTGIFIVISSMLSRLF